MGGGNREQQQAQNNQQAAQAAAVAESPYERRRREFAEGIIKFAEGGDYRNPQGAHRALFNFADPAERAKRRGVRANTRGQGVSALGAGANATVLALDKQHADDEIERDTGVEYQNTLSRVVSGAYDTMGDLHGADQAKKLAVLGNTTARLNSVDQKPTWKDRIFGALGGGL